MRGTAATAQVHVAPVHWLALPDGRTVGYQLDPEIIADCMLREGLGVAALADRMTANGHPTSKGYVHDIINGRRQPREDKVKALADALNVHPRALLLRVVAANSVQPQRESGSDHVPAQAGSATLAVLLLVLTLVLLLLAGVTGFGAA